MAYMPVAPWIVQVLCVMSKIHQTSCDNPVDTYAHPGIIRGCIEVQPHEQVVQFQDSQDTPEDT